ncbi:hypothetical protein MS2017_0378 [Bathymodiolus thermophilus thioautotrophic gill symbiont]|uniref:Membrane fusion protein biotin-lipoyl like domain-containing protein n=1 Tax=Bathymodiolus thermophilus thioautotrophic gill symbiont TaxID=2360 RepID=A0A3G3IJV0_9GAMM|nr:HlyD family efflux transporter periplasmic adaptor subunit [Bathymodiolus thermophilus thioautotrophic gill symbiont]AYQ56123.1 hypothetical protein MS2017_0378 [Bathymodiolus thermophilus thioautotrophic gill symbiont]
MKKYNTNEEYRTFQIVEHKDSHWYLKFTMLIVAIVIVALFFLLNGKYSKKTMVNGYLSPVVKTSKIFANEVGIVSDIRVKNGYFVKAGDVLVKLNKISKSHNTNTLLGNIKLLDKDLQKNIELLKNFNNLQAKVFKYHKKNKKAFKLGLISYNELISSEQKLIELSGKIKKHDLDIEKINSNLKKQRSILASTKDKVQNQNENALDSSFVRAPISGYVSILQLNIGDALRPNKFLMNIVPALNAELEAILYVPVSDIGFVSIGQEIGIHYDTFPYQKFGSFGATISNITKTPTSYKNILFLENSKKKVEFFEVKARLKQQKVPIYSKDVNLIEKMTFSADLILDTRTLIEWLFEPYFGVYRRINIKG